MADDLFQSYEIKEKDGELVIILELDTQLEEFATELGTKPNNQDVNIQKEAKKYIKKRFPKLKMATVAIMAGAIMLSTFPLNKAEAHVADFNMTYLYFGNTQSYITQIDRTQNNLNLVSPSYFDLNTDGSLKITQQFDPTFIREMHNRGIKVVPFLSNHWDRNLGRAALQNRERLSQQIADFIINNNLDGVQVDIENVSDIDRENYTDLVRLLHEKIPKDREVSVAVAANPNGWTKGWHGSYDYKELAKYASYLMIMAYDESYTGGPEGPVASYPWVERSIQYALNQGVPEGKIVLGIPFYGRYWKEGAATGGDGISNKRVDELLARYGGTVTYDEKGKSPKATIVIKQGDPTTTIAGKTLGPGTYHIWYENSESIKAKIDLVHKYNIKGTGSWSLGQENPVIWNDYKTWMTTHDGIPTNNMVTEEQKNTTNPYPSYTVQSGDSLWKIATQFGLTVNQLKEFNYLTSDTIQVGQVLYIVPPPTQTAPTTPTKVNKTKVVPVPVAPSAPAKQVTTPKPATKQTTPATTVKATKTVKKPTLKYGAKGSAVTDVQSKLKKAGFYKAKVNGKFDAATKQAVIKFQKKYKLTADGVVGVKTHSKLDDVTKVKALTYTTLKYGAKGSKVTDLQNKLKKAGFYKVKPTSKFDMTTKRAVINFQKKYKLTPDGIVGTKTHAKLNSVIKK
ncbi:glycosyl hydrolase family 18 protein [Salinibacillus xinjiangensis]|uniref:LysM peptidoglycan-binding domain-containing protein n=1 Tax=Salinibacillus xinjiangensis TaxID=1229268 RepID=A0A6G1X9A6_9BACI|nr:glycosyl hydrolase family 18 protein [Salinibacillus xinjiangensis]MRG87485.1 LysM peptidoglycan-binding domain-containing protein [Salinibacillus xinjiangensis]